MKQLSILIKATIVVFIVAAVGYLGLELPTTDNSVQEEVAQSVSTQDQSTTVESSAHEVVSVIDGDTFEVLLAGEVQTVRVLGIDTPETQYSRQGEECYATQATQAARASLEDTRVWLQTDDSQAQRDTYGRLLAYVTLPDGRDFGARMIANGFAAEYTFITPYQKQRQYQTLEEQAIAQKLGLWTCE